MAMYKPGTGADTTGHRVGYTQEPGPARKEHEAEMRSDSLLISWSEVMRLVKGKPLVGLMCNEVKCSRLGRK